MYLALNEVARTPKYDLALVKACISGAAPLPMAVAQQFEQHHRRRQASSRATGSPSARRSRTRTRWSASATRASIGLPLPDTDVKLVDLDDPDRERRPGERGELCIRGPQVMLGYWNRPEETALMIRNGWLHTGDVAVMDEDGYFHIVDRIKDMILVSGFNVYPTEIEDVLFRHPKILKCAVVGCRTTPPASG